jgi:hypothetical protein
MRISDISPNPMLRPSNPCPVCNGETALAEIEPHPLHANFEIHGYLCERCGPIKSLVVRSAPEVRGGAASGTWAGRRRRSRMQ